MAHWAAGAEEHALLAVPTGSGKTAVSVALPYLTRPRRTLVVVPSVALREQTSKQFRSQEILTRIGAIAPPAEGTAGPKVIEARSRVADWSSLEDADVVVGIPTTVSPANYADGAKPPRDLFDLLIIDEAHHAPAATWQAILDHFTGARAVLLTATPIRRDRKRLPGRLTFHYPLRRAIRDDVYKPVQPVLLDVPAAASRAEIDSAIITATVAEASLPVHASSTVIVRAGTKQRAQELAVRYADAGLSLEVIHSGLGDRTRRNLIDKLQSGQARGAAIVGMLTEGFDLPSIRILAYHDKHKSLPATMQLVGRLARVDPEFPQDAVLVTARDGDVYPQLEGAVRSLYEEDADWAQLLPGLLDEIIAETEEDRIFAQSFTPAAGTVALDAIHPLRRSQVLEVHDVVWTPGFAATGLLANELTPGSLLAGRTVIYSGVSNDRRMLMIVTAARTRPRWTTAAGLDHVEHALHLVTFVPAPETSLPSLLLVNTDDARVQRELLSVIAPPHRRPADPEAIRSLIESLQRTSVSSLGVRSLYAAGQGAPSYRMLAGSRIDRGVRPSDTQMTSLGHVMLQSPGDENSSFTAGISTGKGKYWETRYGSLRSYDAFTRELALRYWYPPAPPSGPLFPDIARARRLDMWPDSPLALEPDPGLLREGWDLEVDGAVIAYENIEFHVGVDPTGALDLTVQPPYDHLPVTAVWNHVGGQTGIWQGTITPGGDVTDVSNPIPVRRGPAHQGDTLATILQERPPTIFFIDGTTVRPPHTHDSRHGGVSPYHPATLVPIDWPGVDITRETPNAAETAATGRISVHEHLELHLRGQVRGGNVRRRWILRNDGSGEIADYLVIEQLRDGTATLSLWHAKPAGGAPSVRTGDFEVALAQAIKSRRWLTDVGLWQEIGARYHGKHPPLTVIEGDPRLLDIICGAGDQRWRRLAWTRRTPLVRGTVHIVQPGLSKSTFEAQLQGVPVPQSAVQCREMFSIFRDVFLALGEAGTILCSP